jgi:hypothetical protein
MKVPVKVHSNSKQKVKESELKNSIGMLYEKFDRLDAELLLRVPFGPSGKSHAYGILLSAKRVRKFSGTLPNLT